MKKKPTKTLQYELNLCPNNISKKKNLSLFQFLIKVKTVRNPHSSNFLFLVPGMRPRS